MGEKHTATPYQVGNFREHKIFTCEENGPVEVATAKRKSDAAFIVRACNAHDDLVSALDKLVGDMDPEGVNPEFNQARAALAKAQGSAS